MKKQKLKKTLVEQILDKAGVSNEGLALNALNGQLVRPDGITDHDIYKTLALSGDKTGPLIGVIPLDAHLDEKKLAKVSGNKKVAMLATKDLQATTGYVHGANNPVGIRQRHNYPIFFDADLRQLDAMIVSAGELGRSVRVNPRQLADFVGAKFEDIKTDENI